MTKAAAIAGVKDGTAVTLFLDSTYPSNRHVFLRPPPLLPVGSLQLAKDTLDSLAAQVGDCQQTRLQEAGKKRKRSPEQDKTNLLKLRKLHIDGFETGQVWQQAKKIIGGALRESTQLLQELQDNNDVEETTGDGVEHTRVVEFGKDGFEVGSDDDSTSASAESGSDADSDDSGSEGSRISDEEDLEALEDEEDDSKLEVDAEGDDEEEGEEGVSEEESADEYEEDPHGLNDGFFSLEEFNKQTQWLEDQDARGDPNTDHFSDEESVDWHKDPFSVNGKGVSGDLDDEDDEDDEDDKDDDSDVEMDEPDDEEAMASTAKDTFDSDEDDGDVGRLEDDLRDMEMDLTANDIYYKDFFAPPLKKKKPGNARKKGRHEQPREQPNEADLERAQNDVRRDLFDDLSDRSGSEDALSDVSAGDPKSRRSAHERRQAKLASEIRKLEAELVAKRAWTLSGEATAADRPVNSLLEEDLEFEHVGKPVPVITEEVSESIESLIKRRILAKEFDEVLRRRPDTLGDPKGARRGLVDVDDTKGKKSLAEIYEEEHVKASNPDAYVSQVDEKLRRDEEEIKQMWKDISGRLDALSSWHYKPKPAAPTLTVVADVATIAMEDAQPTTAQGVAGGESMIAPQEVYAPGKETAESGEVVAKSGLPVARQEMSRDEKLRRRRREKERIRKAGGLDATKRLSKKAQIQKETVSDLKKGGVKVINRKGEVMGLDGKKAEEKAAPTGGHLKL